MKVSFFMIANESEVYVGHAEMPHPPLVGDDVTLMADKSANYHVVSRAWRVVNALKSKAPAPAQLHVLVELNG